jgi:hypothetical protein
VTTAPPPRTVVTDALVDMLAAVTLRPCWGPDGPDPTHDNYGLFPYLVVDLVGAGVSYGTVGAPEDTAEVVWQVTAVGETFTSAQIAMDKARAAILERDGLGDGFSNQLLANSVTVVERFRLTCCIQATTDNGVEGGVPGAEVDDVLDGGAP